MSKFFRSASSDSSSSGESADELEQEDTSISNSSRLSFVNDDDTDATHDISRTFNQLSLPSQSPNGEHRDLLLHTLLEDHCVNQVLQEQQARGNHRATRTDSAIKNEARVRYQQLCAQLAPHNLIPPGLEHDRMAATRQRYRDGLNVLSRTDLPAASARPTVPAPLRRLITDSNSGVGPSSGLQSWPWGEGGVPHALNAINSTHPVLEPSRYIRDFDELGLLGKGGYGMVFHVKNKLDDLQYAVKKVPISHARFVRIQRRGQSELDDLLRELRTLARLDHPNIVRYHAGWIEWSDIGRTASSSGGLGESMSGFENDSKSAVAGAQDETNSLSRVITQSNSLGTDIVFENSVSQQATSSNPSSSTEDIGGNNTMSESFTDGALVRTNEPTLALHLQMGLCPLTLADFLSPPQRSDESVAPLTHCFHLEPSISILQAVLEGVDYLHAEGIVHRDLKPANIFMSANSNPRSTNDSVDLFLCSQCRNEGTPNPVKLNVRIGDFGLVTALGLGSAGEMEESQSPAVGTEIYRPLASVSNASPALDIFALGIVSFEMLWKFTTRMERHDTIFRLKRGEFPPRFSERIGDNSGQMQNCIKDMLNHDQDDDITIQTLKERLTQINSPTK